jgi:Phage capsid protein
MSENLFKLYVTQFSTLLNLKLQQTQSKLRGRCMEGNHYGKQASPIQYIGAIQMKAPAGRFEPLQRQDVDFTRRWVFPVDKEAQQLIDRFDELKLLQDPQSQYVAVAAAAVAREWDDRLIGAAFSTAQIGADAGSLSAEVFNTGSTVTSAGFQVPAAFGASASAGLLVAKMIETKRAMRKLQVPVDDEPLTWITNSQGESDLLNQVQVVSTDFTGADRPTLLDGKVTRFMGWDIVYSERLVSTSSVRQNIAWVRSGIYLGVWKDTQNDISQRKDLSSLPYQLWTGMSSGATRLEPGRLMQVLCADSSAAADVTP